MNKNQKPIIKNKITSAHVAERKFIKMGIGISPLQLYWIIGTDEKEASEIPTWKFFLTKKKDEMKKEKECLQAIHEDDRDKVSQILSHAVSTKNQFKTEFRMHKDSNNYQSIFMRGFPLCKKNGNIREWIGTSMLVSNSKNQ